MEEELKKFISLQEASKLCDHSQEYLSLRARQKKLRAVKLGRNWVTTREWLNEYLLKAENYKNNLNNKNNKKPKKELFQSQKQKKEAVFQKQEKSFQKETVFTSQRKKIVSAPDNLPIGEVKLLPVQPIQYLIIEFLKNFFKKAVSSSNFRFGFSFVMTLILIVAVGIWGRDSFKVVRNDVDGFMLFAKEKISQDEIYSAAIYDTMDVFKDYFKWIGSSKPGRVVKNTYNFVWRNTKEGYLIVKDGYVFSKRFCENKLLTVNQIISNNWNSLIRSAKKFAYEIKESYFGFKEICFAFVKDFTNTFQSIEKSIGFNFIKTREFLFGLFKPIKVSEVSEIVKETKEGLVVVPSSDKDAEMKEKIKQSFSDEVKVEMTDKTSGYITPIFKTGEGEKYLYLLVPIKN